MTKLLVVLLAAAAFVAFGGSKLLDRASEAAPAVADLLDRGADPEGQSAAQLSAAEFLRLPHGASQPAVEARVGRPERRYRVALERVELECWYYGIAGATGAYQLCFLGGKLNSKVGFGATGEERGSLPVTPDRSLQTDVRAEPARPEAGAASGA